MFNREVLFDEFEEIIDIPAMAINVGNLQPVAFRLLCSNGDELELYTGLHLGNTQVFCVFLPGYVTGQTDDRININAGVLIKVKVAGHK